MTAALKGNSKVPKHEASSITTAVHKRQSSFANTFFTSMCNDKFIYVHHEECTSYIYNQSVYIIIYDTVGIILLKRAPSESSINQSMNE